ncbi:MAG: CRISPR-associated endonuclease Cas2 [Patescibacteria group bacterium]
MSSSKDTRRKRLGKGELQKIILQIVGTVGLLAVAVLAPNAIQALSKLGIIGQKRQREVISLTRKQLVKNKLLTEQKNILKLTPKGEAKLRQLELNDFKFKRPARWDRKWRILMFDIEESRNVLRNKIRKTLAAIGFLRLQNSVWIYPYPCENLIALLKADFQIGSELLYITADSIEYDIELRKSFDLS